MKHFMLTIAAFIAVSGLSFPGSLAAQNLTPYLSQEAVASSLAILPAPPEPGSVEFLLDEYCYQRAKLLRDTPRGHQAVVDANMDGSVLLQFAESFGLEIRQETMPATYELLMRAKECFGTYGCSEAKNHYKRTRPFAYYGEPSLTPQSEAWLVHNGSYPSGHSANFYGLSYILCTLRPECQDAILKRGEDGAYSRVIVGVHWMSDIQASHIVAAAVFARLQADEEYKAQWRLAKEEVDRALGRYVEPARQPRRRTATNRASAN
ncbi:MAG: phosphatase PAP2 family protein [Bacteroidales bacterium]|jgi:acid phosphatase (class A)|nr:phosphatase PAP2 family protein [Bacteroidales bacterium]